MDQTDSVVQNLKTLTQNLLFASESEYPFDTVLWVDRVKDLSNEAILQKTGHSGDTPIKTVELDDLFHRAIQVQEWYDETQRLQVGQFQELLNYLKSSLENIKVFKLGEVEYDTYILGEVGKNVVGLSTKVVQT
jgi:Nuclease A inhibitor-like protein